MVGSFSGASVSGVEALNSINAAYTVTISLTSLLALSGLRVIPVKACQINPNTWMLAYLAY